MAAAHAKTVILLHPDDDSEAEVHKTAALLSLQSSRSHPSTTLKAQRVVLQNPDTPAPGRTDSRADAAARSIGGVVQRSFKLVEVNGQRNMARLIAQSAVQPGVSTILGQVRWAGAGAWSQLRPGPLERSFWHPPNSLHAQTTPQICQSAPGAPDFHIVDLEQWQLLDGEWSGSSGGAVTYQVRGCMGGRAGCACGGCPSLDSQTARPAPTHSLTPPSLPPRLPGRSQVARRKLANAVVCGYICGADRATHLNPPDATLLFRGDKLIVLARKAAPEMARGGSTAMGLDVVALQARLEAAHPPASMPKSIVVVGWSGPTVDLVVGDRGRIGAVGEVGGGGPPVCGPNGHVSDPAATPCLQSGLCDFAVAGSEVTIVSPSCPPDFPGDGQAESADGSAAGGHTWEMEGRSVRWVEGGIMDRAAYERAGVASAHAVILGSLQTPDAKDSDARMLTRWGRGWQEEQPCLPCRRRRQSNLVTPPNAASSRARLCPTLSPQPADGSGPGQRQLQQQGRAPATHCGLHPVPRRV